MMSEDCTIKSVQENSLNKNLIINNAIIENDSEIFIKSQLHKSNSHKNLVSVETLQEKSIILGKNELYLSENNHSTNPDSIALENNNSFYSETFYNQNIINFEEVLKIIVIGDKGVGKSLLVNRLVSEKSSNRISSGYIPTES